LEGENGDVDLQNGDREGEVGDVDLRNGDARVAVEMWISETEIARVTVGEMWISETEIARVTVGDVDLQNGDRKGESRRCGSPKRRSRG
jgi:hypothetical protein